MDDRIADLSRRLEWLEGQCKHLHSRVGTLGADRDMLLRQVDTLATTLQTATEALDESDHGIRETINEALTQVGTILQRQMEFSRALARLDDGRPAWNTAPPSVN